MKLVLATAVVAGLSGLSIPGVHAWGGAGHEIVATIAQVYLHPTTLSNVCEILYPGSAKDAESDSSSPPCHLSRIASWADQVRREAKYRYTASLHYVGALEDHPGDHCAFPGDRGWAGKQDANVLGAIRNMTGILVGYTDGYYNRELAEESVKFLVHYVGDMHQPLHLTGRERGGNGAKVAFDGRATNLHSLWDSFLIAQALRTIPRKYTRPFPPGTTTIDVETHLRGTIYDPYIRRVMYEGMGVGDVEGKFEGDIEDWTSCPVPAAEQKGTPSLWNSLQTVLGFTRTKDENRWDDDVLCPYAWATPMHKLNCDLPIWPAALDKPPYNHTRFSDAAEDTGCEHHETEDPASFFSRPRRPHPELLELDTPEYAGRIRDQWIVERQVAMGGIRLAGILNGLFMDVDSLQDECTPLPLILV